MQAENRAAVILYFSLTVVSEMEYIKVYDVYK